MGKGFLGFTPGEAVVVTGGGSGIGAATARMAADEGLHVCVWDVSADSAQEVVADIADTGGDASAFHVDLEDREAVADTWRRTVQVAGDVSYLINVAGPASFGESDFQSGVRRALECMRSPIETWIDQGTGPEPSTALFSSVQGTHYGAGVEWYTVAKGAILAYMKSVAAMRTGGLRANAVLPDWTLTPRTQPHVGTVLGGEEWAANPMGRIGHPEDCAAAALFLVAPCSAYINGVVIEVDGGVHLRSAAWLAANA